jgi:hypothetical protein
MPAVQYNQNLNIINQWRERVGAESFDDQLFEAVEQTIIDSDMEAARLKLKFDEYAGVVSVSIKEDLLPQFREILSLVKAEHVGIEWGGKVEVGKRKVGELNEEVELVLTDDESDSDEEGEVEEELSDQ